MCTIVAEITAIELLDRYEAGERDFRGLDLSGLQLRRRETCRRKIIVEGADFSGANMSKCRFSTQNLHGGIFRNVDFTRAVFGDTSILDCEMGFTNFTRTNIAESGFERVNLEGANFTNAIFFQTGISKCKLTDTIFRGARLEESEPMDGRLTRVDFTGARDLYFGSKTKVIFDQTIMPDGSIRNNTP